MGEFGGTRLTLDSSLDCGKLGALLHQPGVRTCRAQELWGTWSLGEAALMELGALRDPEPVAVAPSGLSSLNLALSLGDEALEEVTGWDRDA